MWPCLIQMDGYDPVGAVAVSLYASSVDDPSVCHLNGQTWWPAISQLPTLRLNLFEGDFSGRAEAPSSSMALATEPWANFPRYALADARVRLWTGNVGDGWGAYTLRFDGRAVSEAWVDDGISS